MKKVILLLILFSLSNVFAQTYYTQKNNNYLREGPGAYYPLLKVLPKGTKVVFVSGKKSWSKVKTNDNQTGWISKNSLSKTNTKKSISELAKKWSSAKVSATSLAGAIKGLMGKAGESGNGDFERLLRYTHYSVTPFQITNFISELAQHSSSNRDEVDFDDADLQIPKYDPDFNVQQIGLGVAARIAAKPIVANERVRNYLYLIMNALLNNSDFYDYEFSVILLNERQADGFSCPGGIIFITKGVFLVAKDESELAAAVAHELGHQILQHGGKELGKRKNIIKSDDMFAELDEATGEKNDEDKQVEGDLNKLMASSYERAVHTRTLEYELDADRFASILLANSGYDPFAIIRLTSRLAKTYSVDKDIFSEDYLAPNDIKTRAEKIKKFVEDNFDKDNPGARLKGRFDSYYNLLFR